MDRIIEVLVSGSYLTKDNAVGGVQGEANSTYLRIEFDESWDGLAKTIHWWNAKGEGATGVVLTVDQIENILESERVYLTPVPNEATTVSGKCMFAVDGYINGKRQRSAYGQLIVQPGPSGTDVKIEVPTPTQIEQLQTQIEVLLDSIAGASGYAKAAAESATASQSWAAGGTGTREGEDTDNARYWAQLARDLFDPGEGEAGVAITLANHISNETIHITDEEREEWNKKAGQDDIALTKKELTAVVEGQTYRENLLINADFRDPVDTKQGHVVPPGTAYYADTGLSEQAGALEKYAAAVKEAGGYGSIIVSGKRYYVDWAQAVRGYTGLGKHLSPWHFPQTSGTVKLNDKSVTVCGGNLNASFFNQKLSIPLAGETVTASLLTADGKLSWASGTFPTETDREMRVANATAENGVTFRVFAAGPGLAYTAYVSVRVPAEAEIDVSAAKLELGDYQTLAHQDENGNWVLNEAPNKAKQLALCSQYDPETGEFYDELLARQSQVEKLEGALSKTEEKAGKALGESWKVGDILHSARQDLDERWLLCNGEAVPAGYEALDKRMFDIGTTAFTRVNVINNDARFLYDMATDGERWAAVGDSATPCGLIVVGDGQMRSQVELEEDSRLYGIACHGGMWVAIGEGPVTGTTAKKLCVYTAAAPTGPWAKRELPDYTSPTYSALHCHEGTWVIAARNASGYPVVLTTADPVEGTWTEHVLEEASVAPTGVAHQDGTWAVCGGSGRVWLASELSGPWTKTVMPSASASLVAIHGEGGVWLTTTASGGYIATDPYGTWTAAGNGGYQITCRDGLWVTAGASGYLYYTEDPAGTWTGQLVADSSTTMRGVVWCGDRWVAVGYHTSSEYPRIRTLETLGGSYTTEDMDTFATDVKGLICHDGVFLAVGTTTGTGKCFLLAARDPAGPWWYRDISGFGIWPERACAHGGRWVVVGRTKISNTSGYPAILTAEDPFGEWTFRQLSDSQACQLADVCAQNGRWVAVGSDSSRTHYVWTTEEPAGVWEGFAISTDSGNMRWAACHDGLWAAVRYNSNYIYIYTATNPAGVATWTMAASVSASTPVELHCVDGTWVIVQGGLSILVADDPAGPWEKVPLPAGSLGTSGSRIESLGNVGGKWIAVGTSFTATTVPGSTVTNTRYFRHTAQSFDIRGGWTVWQESRNDQLTGIAGEARAAVCGYEAPWVTAGAGYQVLPVISPDRSYAYIRGKE